MAENTSFAGQTDDMEAIYAYMKVQVPKTDDAATVRKQFIAWYENLGFWDKSWSDAAYDEARSRRNLFNIKNAVAPAEKAQVEKVLATGMTTEQLQGKPRPVINIKTGAVGSQVKNPTVPGIAPGLTRFLKLGVKGDDVKQWQSFLGLTPPTGYFDQITDKKTRDFQRAQNLKVDGVVGKDTWGAAFAAKASPFAEPVSKPVAASISNPFKPAAKAPAFAPAKPAATSAPRPVSKPATSAPSPSAPVTPPMVTAQASMIPGLNAINKLPLWAKLLGMLGIGAGAVYGLKKYPAQHSR